MLLRGLCRGTALLITSYQGYRINTADEAGPGLAEVVFAGFLTADRLSPLSILRSLESSQLSIVHLLERTNVRIVISTAFFVWETAIYLCLSVGAIPKRLVTVGLKYFNLNIF